MSEEVPEEDTRAAEYALRLLSLTEEAEFERRMATDPALEAEVRDWIARFDGLNTEFREVVPPRRVKEQLTTRLFGNPDRKPSFWQRVGLWQAVSVASLALAGYFGAQQLQFPDTTSLPDTVFISEITDETESLRLLAVYDSARGEMKITRTAGAAPAGRVLELWAIAGNSQPVSLGVLPDDGRSTISVPEQFQSNFGTIVLAISEEPPGGSPTGTPTGAVLATGSVTEI